MKIVFVSGTFNILHPGHLRLLRFAKQCGDRLIVAVLSDDMAGYSAHMSQELRLDGVLSNLWVDEAFIATEPVSAIIARLRPDIVVKGKEHENLLNVEARIVTEYGGKLLFSSGEESFSSLDLIRREFAEYDSHAIKLPFSYMERHGINNISLCKLLESFNDLKICVIGDLIVDEYITCQPLGMSQEDPTIVVTPVDSSRFVGGAGIVAAHAAGMGTKVFFLSVSGSDSIRNYAVDYLNKAGVNAQILVDESRPTTLKQRYRSKGKTLLRVSHLHQTAISLELQKKMLDQIQAYLLDIDLLVFSDFNYGCLPQNLINQVIANMSSNNKKIITVADSQSSSQVGDIGRFKGMDLLTPTEREARISTRNREDGLIVMAEQLRQQTQAANIFIKLGEEGLLIHANSETANGWMTDRVEALNSAPKDVAGAGDSLLITAAMTLAAGGSIWEAACLGSLAAAVQVGRVGNTPIQTDELLRELR
jgi:rfaE bifunctional protein kinase chain/domain